MREPRATKASWISVAPGLQNTRENAEAGSKKNDPISGAYENRTESAQSGGLETDGPRERISSPGRWSQCGGFHAKPVVIGLLCALNTPQRMLVAGGLAEGEELGSNVL